MTKKPFWKIHSDRMPIRRIQDILDNFGKCLKIEIPNLVQRAHLETITTM